MRIVTIWTTDGIDATGADERVRQLSKLLKEYGYTINYLTNDLHNSKENIITTEYEDKFTSQGLKINYLEASKKGDNHESI